MAVRYTQEQKAAALKSIEEVGLAKTAENMNIAVQTLYKWRNDSGAEKSPPKSPSKSSVKAKASEARTLLANDRTLQKKNDQLEEENKALRATLARYKSMLVAAMEEGK
ncbi:MAG: transposase [Candidatus Limiplasma sp.]|nr:transposase [Candidatus Limiplasma sp.]